MTLGYVLDNLVKVLGSSSVSELNLKTKYGHVVQAEQRHEHTEYVRDEHDSAETLSFRWVCERCRLTRGAADK